MEVNGYLPTHVRVFTDDSNAFHPQVLTEAINLELDGLDMEQVYALKHENRNDDLFKYLIITQCNALNAVLPGMFQKIEDYTELLFPDNLLREGSAVEQMIALIPEEDWKDAVQIIGWLYQYYNSEKKDDVFAALKRNVKITKENIPAATQLFTPDWIVRYMVENSLGRLWVEGHPNHELKSGWKYYLEEAEQEPEVQAQLAEIRREYAALNPEDIRCIDPCCGSGHILVYMFDVLVQIYESHGYSTRDAVHSIVEHNLYGLDIDGRAAQLAYFSVMMKGRQYDSRFFKRGVQPHVYAIAESNQVNQFALEYYCNGNAGLTNAMNSIMEELHDAKEYGSILTITPQDWPVLYARFDEIQDEISMYKDAAMQLLPLVQVAEALALKYHVVVTNPPYLSISNAGITINEYIKTKYINSKNDLYSVFIERCHQFTLPFYYQAMITQQAWMFTELYENLRMSLREISIISLAHIGSKGFDEIGGEVVQTASFIFRNSYGVDYRGRYCNLTDGENEGIKENMYLRKQQCFEVVYNDFRFVPHNAIAYWLSYNALRCFGKEKIGDSATTREGMTTADNGRFLRYWYEVSWSKVAIGTQNIDSAISSKLKWFPYNKGGTNRKWYGNNEFVVNWENDGYDIKTIKDKNTGKIRSHNYNAEYSFRESGTWTAICSGNIMVRLSILGALFDSKGASLFTNRTDKLRYIIGMLNSKVSDIFLKVLSPAYEFKVGHVANVPLIYSKEGKVVTLVEKNIDLSTYDWDSFEASWDFQRHPLIRPVTTIAEALLLWENECKDRFHQLKTNEEELNRIFIEIYGLQDELTPEVEDKDVTVRKADLQRDIKSLISYAVGCMFGRYSLDVPGLAYAGGEWDAGKYSSYPADKDNIIPICDDEFFEEDVLGRFVDFIRTVYGADTLDENLKFIAEALGGKGQPKEVIRDYFINGFYADHLKTYQKRPIYWLFDSGKKNGFKCLIYMHRYQPDTIARIRTDYVHEQQSRYRTAISDLEGRMTAASTSERVKLTRQMKKLQEQAEEVRVYEEKIHHLADQMISIDLDDGVKHNYALFQDVLAKIK